MDAAYLVEEHSKFRGELEGDQLDVTGAEARGKPLFMLLRRIDGRKAYVVRWKGKQIVDGGSVKSAMSLEGRIQQIDGAAEEQAENDQRDLSDEAHIDGLEFIPWTLSRLIPDRLTLSQQPNNSCPLATTWPSLPLRADAPQ